MAGKQEPHKSDDQERKIPVFTVLKNNSILKNIYLLNNLPSIFDENSDKSRSNHQVYEESLLVGRHPDCNITLEHPSISRFHVRIHSRPSSRKLSVIDLCSVHGTLVSGKKIEQGVPVELNEGDTVQLGASSRVYMLHWVPLTRAYDLEDPFIPQLDSSVEERVEQTNQDGSFLCVESKQIQPDGFEGLDLLFSDENSKSSVTLRNVSRNRGRLESELALLKSRTDKVPFQSLLVDSTGNSNSEASVFNHSRRSENNQTQSTDDDFEDLDLLFSDESPKSSKKKANHLSPSVPGYVNSSFSHEDEENQTPKVFQEQKSLRPPSINRSRLEPEMAVLKSRTDKVLSRSLLVDSTGKSNSKASVLNPTTIRSEDHQIQSMDNYFEGLDLLFSDESSKTSTKKAKTSAPLLPEYINSSFSDEDKENWAPKMFQEQRSLRPASRKRGRLEPEMALLKSRTDKVSCWSLLVDSTGKSNSNAAVLNPTLRSENNQILSMVNDFEGLNLLFSDEGSKSPVKKTNPPAPPIPEYTNSSFSDGDRQNRTPKVFQRQRYLRLASRNGARLEAELAACKSRTDKVPFLSLLADSTGKGNSKSSVLNPTLGSKNNQSQATGDDFERFDLLFSDKFSKSSRKKENPSAPPVPADISTSFSDEDKENNTPKLFQKQRSLRPASRNQARLEPGLAILKSRRDRVPLRPLVVNSNDKSNSKSCVLNPTLRSGKSINYPPTIEKNNAGREENKKWTMVVDSACLLNKESRKALQLLQGLKGTQLIIPRIVIRELDCKKQCWSLFRRKTQVSSALQWIEECMLNNESWIHVQSSVEEGSLLEIVSPTAEDHILECALFFRNIKNDGQLVLLSDDITLKIKAMAEGLICEPAEDFRGSLVNPFSERFLWADSSPRGATWTCVDDIVLREKYYPCH
ncbi:unnamed protein product [Ilex paraguariensis]|uniref:FHA domain-containing protein n=1 Tax=Ilex paraguariensis TaxID=185542 RepID=A0ABC8UX74_9AQUA